VDAAAGRTSIAVIEAAFESSRSGAEVEIAL
jgi:hypothetical protein